jgi:hypothetical protein
MKAVLTLSLVIGANAHGSMIMPLGRNSIDAETPEWSDGKVSNRLKLQ